MNHWVRVRGVNGSEIANWCNENYVTYERHNDVVNPSKNGSGIGFRIDSDWFIADEKELLLFKLKWSGSD